MPDEDYAIGDYVRDGWGNICTFSQAPSKDSPVSLCSPGLEESNVEAIEFLERLKKLTPLELRLLGLSEVCRAKIVVQVKVLAWRRGKMS